MEFIVSSELEFHEADKTNPGESLKDSFFFCNHLFDPFCLIIAFLFWVLWRVWFLIISLIMKLKWHAKDNSDQIISAEFEFLILLNDKNN